MRKNYPTNLTESQYNTILRIIGDKRKRRNSLKGVFDAIFYLLKTGCQWRMLPSDFPKWELVYYYFKNGATTAHSKRYMRFCEKEYAKSEAKMYLQALQSLIHRALRRQKRAVSVGVLMVVRK